tara:strand:- start:2883 stop:2999 length:117 start_codon:yes stop_codon:yes gene_type:complete
MNRIFSFQNIGLVDTSLSVERTVVLFLLGCVDAYAKEQ